MVLGVTLLWWAVGVSEEFAAEESTATVIVIGAGAAGSTAAWTLREAGVDVVVLEGRNRIGGRTFTKDFNPVGDGTSSVGVDLGANYIHGASLQQQVFLMARQWKVELGDVAGGYWDHLDVATWYNPATGQRIGTETVALAKHLEALVTCELGDYSKREEVSVLNVVSNVVSNALSNALPHTLRMFGRTS